MVKYFLKIEGFEGPLDLLLYLVKLHEINILDIDIADLTEKYLKHLRLMEFKDLHQAAVFLDMAATLCLLKAQTLLGEREIELTDDSTEKTLTSEDLQRQLLEYGTFKSAGEYFNEILGQDRQWSSLEGRYYWDKQEGLERPVTGDPWVLVVLYEQMLGGVSERVATQVTTTTEQVPLADVMDQVRQELEKLERVALQDWYSRIPSRYELVAYFLAVLELVKNRIIQVQQNEVMGAIWLSREKAEHGSH